MDNPEYEVVAAFLDGERVDVDALKRALSEPDGRDYLVDLLTLRESVGETVVPSPVSKAGFATSPARRRGYAAAAAVLAGVVGLGGYAMGRAAHLASVSVRDGSLGASAIVIAPEPTRVIRLEPGVNWMTATGGK